MFVNVNWWVFLFYNGMRRERNVPWMLLEPDQFIKDSLCRGCFLTQDAKSALLGEAPNLLGSICLDKIYFLFLWLFKHHRLCSAASVNEALRSRWSSCSRPSGHCGVESRFMAFLLVVKTSYPQGRVLCAMVLRSGAENLSCLCLSTKWTTDLLSSQNKGGWKQ